MPRVWIDTPKLTDGVSQQPDSRRFRSQAADIKNAWLSVVEGLDKRNGTAHVAEILSSISGNFWTHWVDIVAERLDVDPATGLPTQAVAPQRYVFVGSQPQSAGTARLRCFDLDGTEVHVEDSVSGGGTLGTAPTFAYVATGSSVSARENLRFLTIADNTFIINRSVLPAMDPSVESSPDQYGRAFVFIRAANYLSDYEVSITDSLGTNVSTATTWDGKDNDAPDTPPLSPQNPIQVKTEDIAAELAYRINLTGITATVVGSVIMLEGTITQNILAVEVHDSVGDTNMEVLFENITTSVDLPLTCRHDFKVRVIGDPNIGGDDYIIKFVAEGGAGTFGTGSWEQALAHDSEYIIDPSTMPQKLVRRTGTGAALPSGYAPISGEVYFTYEAATWENRQTGDSVLVPDPSFIGQPIENMFLVRNRLGVLADDNILLTEVNGFFNFFRTDLANLLDSDPIDVAIGHSDVSFPRLAAPFENDLIVWTERNQFRIPGEIELTPKTVGVRHISSFLTDVDVQPVSSGTGLYFAERNEGFSGLRELYRRGDSGYFDAANLSQQTPKYIPGRIREIASAAQSQCVALILDDPSTANESSVFVYQYHWSGNERVQSAWHEWTFPDAKVLSGHFFNDRLYLLLERDGVVSMEYLDTYIGGTEAQHEFRVKMDRRIAVSGGSTTYDNQTNLTRITMPYDIGANETPQVLTWSFQTPPAPSNAMLNVAEVNRDTPGAHYIDVVGDQTGVSLMWVGIRYDMEYTFGSLLVKQPDSKGERAIHSGPNQVFDGLLAFEDSGPFEVQVSYRGGGTATYENALGVLDDAVLGDFAVKVVLNSGELPFAVLADARSCTIKIVNRLPYPSKIQRAEWSVESRPKHRRLF